MISAAPCSQPVPLAFSREGEYGLLCDANPRGAPSLEVQRTVWEAARRIGAWPDVLEVVPGMNNLLLVFREPFAQMAEACERVRAVWPAAGAAWTPGRIVRVPVVYGGDFGEDLPEVARRTGLSAAEYARRHAAGCYVVYALGSQPGFAYLGGLDPALAVPRRDVPRPRLEAGAVIVGGAQAGILSRTTPSGWHVIGRTGLQCFDETAAEPALFAPGDEVRFEIEDIQA